MTDGSRIFYEAEDEPGSLLREASVEGGEADLVPMPLKDHAAMAIRLPSELLSLGDPLAATNDAGAVWHMTLPGGQPQRIGNFQANDASWSPDGNSVYWALNGKMSVTRLDGTETKPIVTMQGYAGNIAFSPDGTRMRFSVTSRGASTSTIWEASPDGSHPHPLFSQRDRMGSQCCGMWTPDGRYYVFQADRGGTRMSGPCAKSSTGGIGSIPGRCRSPSVP
jgi:Tol biopolymer transport system component